MPTFNCNANSQGQGSIQNAYGDTARGLTWSALAQGAYRVRARTMDYAGAGGAYTSYVYFDVILTPYVPRIML